MGGHGVRGLASPHPILGAICGLSAVAVHQHRRRHPFRAANADPHGPDYSADYRVSTVAVRFRCLMSLLCWSCCVRNVRVHSSSCGAHRDVVHSPLDWLYHRCHCKCRDLVFVGRLLTDCCRVFTSRCRVVVVFSLPVLLTMPFGTV